MSYESSTQRLRWTFSENELSIYNIYYKIKIEEKRVNVYNEVAERFEKLQNEVYSRNFNIVRDIQQI